MTEFHAEPDFEAIAIDYLAGIGSVTALVATDDQGPMISSKLRSSWRAGLAALRITRIGGLPTEQAAQHLVRGRLQVEAYAVDEDTAWTLARHADLVLRSIAGVRGSAVVTSIGKDLGMVDSPDPASDSARVVFGVVLYAHGVAA